MTSQHAVGLLAASRQLLAVALINFAASLVVPRDDYHYALPAAEGSWLPVLSWLYLATSIGTILTSRSGSPAHRDLHSRIGHTSSSEAPSHNPYEKSAVRLAAAALMFAVLMLRPASTRSFNAMPKYEQTGLPVPNGLHPWR